MIAFSPISTCPANVALLANITLENDPLSLQTDVKNRLKSQAFIRVERIKELLDESDKLIQEKCPLLKSFMKLYIENPVARSILLRPILQDAILNFCRLKVIIFSCIDAGSSSRELDTKLLNLNNNLKLAMQE